MAYDLAIVTFQYTNHRGVVATREVLPIRIWFGSTAWYREPQWLLEAFDLGKQEKRDFALSKMSGWSRRDEIKCKAEEYEA